MNARPIALIAALAFAVLAVTNAHAQPGGAYPEKTIRIIVPFPAGGATDIIARIVGERLSGAWNRPVVVENVSGAAGATGTAQTAKASQDGYSLLTATGTTTTLLPHLRANLPYNPMRDFDAVSLLCSFANVLVVRPEVPARTVAELIGLLRANPGKYSYASSGYGASPHLSAEWFKLITKTDILHVPFTGSGPALPALLGGHVDMMFDTMPSVWPLAARRRNSPPTSSATTRSGSAWSGTPASNWQIDRRSRQLSSPPARGPPIRSSPRRRGSRRHKISCAWPLDSRIRGNERTGLRRPRPIADAHDVKQQRLTLAGTA